MKLSLPRLFLSLAVGGLVWSVLLAQNPPKKEPPRKDDIPDSVKGAVGLEEALRRLHAPLAGGEPTPPKDALTKLKPREGLAVDLVAHEPTVQQPLAITFDERGRMWVMQYRQYPFPAGLKITHYDRYIRARFDKVPPPPPNHFKGADKITIHSDPEATGRFDRVKTFVEGLNIATSVLHGRGGVWVMNPPYLLFYPDRDRDDVPDGPPVVHLSGFGLEDTHAVASSLRWGPDGWIYGAQGSTCTARVKVEVGNKSNGTTDFLGQAIWRYHPEKHIFELFAEGGGNTFGVAFDDEGNVYSGTNWGRYRGLHFVQGGYYVKGWGKHGPLTNPHALGWFEHMPHTGNADRLTHTFIVYGGDALPESFRGKIIGPSPLQKRIQMTRLEPERSSFRTAEEPFLMTSSDGWFRPVDLTAGPDGCLYIADLYENRISHVDPRDNWHRESGRIYRLRPEKAVYPKPFDLGKKTSGELVELLAHRNRWYRETARRLLGDRKDRSVIPSLLRNLERDRGQLALESLWALYQVGGLSEDAALKALGHANPAVRRWTVRLLGDDHCTSAALVKKLAELARGDSDPRVRSQLASTAKRIPGPSALPILVALWGRDEDLQDPHIPLLTWWALEAHAASDRPAVLKLFASRELWRLPMVETTILERLAQRYAQAGGKEDLLACAALFNQAPEARQAERLLNGLEKALAATGTGEIPEELRKAVLKAGGERILTARVTLGVRLGLPIALKKALEVIASDKADLKKRLEYARVFTEVDCPDAVPVLLQTLRQPGPLALRKQAVAALQRQEAEAIGREVVALLIKGEPDAGLRAEMHDLLATRAGWARTFLAAIESGKLNPRGVSLDIVRKLLLSRDREVVKLAEKHWGKVKSATSEEKKKEILRLGSILKAGKGDSRAGKLVFASTCGKCHKLFGQGSDVGPELTFYERDNLLYWLENIVDPSAMIRDEYLTFNVETRSGRTLVGIIAQQDRESVTLKDGEGKIIRLPRSRIADLRASTTSLMPEDQLKALKDQEIRDLFAFLTSPTPVR